MKGGSGQSRVEGRLLAHGRGLQVQLSSPFLMLVIHQQRQPGGQAGFSVRQLTLTAPTTCPYSAQDTSARCKEGGKTQD